MLYLDDDAGELYDLQTDPGEVDNLWQSEALRAMRDELSMTCLHWLAGGSLFANRRTSRAAQQAMRI